MTDAENAAPTEEEFDPVRFALDYMRGGEQIELAELDRPIGLELVDFFNSVVKLPNPADAELLAAFTMIPSRLSYVIPVFFIKGEPGSGKSELLEAVAQVLGKTKYAGNSTGASIKNLINMIRWSDPKTLTHEKQCHLLLDNVEQDSFDPKSQLLGACLNGYNRLTDIQFISAGNGENIEFRTFCPKAFTTIWDYESKELSRRSIYIFTKKYENLDGYGEEQPQISSIRAVVSKYWNQQLNCTNFVTLRRGTKWTKNAFPINKERFDLTVDMVCAGVTAGVWADILTGFQAIADYYQLIGKRTSKLDAIVLEALEKYTGEPIARWSTIPVSIKVDIKPKDIKKAVDDAVDAGVIKKPKIEQIQEAVAKFGFAIPRNNSGGVVYRMTPQARKIQ